MENKIVKVIGHIGNFVLVNIDGKNLKAKVEGNIPSSVFLGELIKDKDKIIVKVKDPLILSKSLDNILSEVNVSKSRINLLITKLLLLFSVPISESVYSIFKEYNLPFLLSVIVLKSNKEFKKFLFLLEKSLEKDRDNALTDSELELVVNSFFLNTNENFKVFSVDGFKEKWYGYFKFDGDNIKRFVFTTNIDDVDVVIVFDNRKMWNLEIDIFGDIVFNRESTSDLRLKLEELGFKPITIEVRVFGGI
ncbi:MAG: hypothetical protein ACPL4C_05040 [Brevinematia bacterium]